MLKVSGSGDVRRHLMGEGTSGWFLSPHLAKMTGLQDAANVFTNVGTVEIAEYRIQFFLA
jgi:hypothetical protein